MGFLKKTGGVCALVHFLAKRKQCGHAQHGPWGIWHVAGVSAVDPEASGVDPRHPVWAQTRARSLRYRLCLTLDVGGTLFEAEADVAPAHCCAVAPLSCSGQCPLCSGLLLSWGPHNQRSPSWAALPGPVSLGCALGAASGCVGGWLCHFLLRALQQPLGPWRTLVHLAAVPSMGQGLLPQLLLHLYLEGDELL